MKSFFRKLLWFILPVVLLYLLALGGAVYSGEAMPLAMVIDMQSADTQLIYRPMYLEQTIGYKVLTTVQRQPQVLALGSSRVLQFRQELFNRPNAVFYNTGATFWRIRELQATLRGLDGQWNPDVLLVELDLPWFHPLFPLFYENANYTIAPFDFLRTLAETRNVAQALLAGKTDFNTMLSRRDPISGGTALGLSAMNNGNGYRYDGSMQLPLQAIDPESIEQFISRDNEHLRTGDWQYLYGDEVSQTHLREFESLLVYAQEHGSFVIGFAPPYTAHAYHTMMADGKHAYLFEALDELATLFNHYGFAFFDFSDPDSVGVTDQDFSDSWHSSEQAALLMYIHMLRAQPDVLGQYSDLAALEQIAGQVTHPFNVFGQVN